MSHQFDSEFFGPGHADPPPKRNNPPKGYIVSKTGERAEIKTPKEIWDGLGPDERHAIVAMNDRGEFASEKYRAIDTALVAAACVEWGHFGAHKTVERTALGKQVAAYGKANS